MRDAAMEKVLAALGGIRAPIVPDEWRLQELVGDALAEAGVAFVREERIAPRCRVDFLCEGGVAIEVKRGKPSASRLLPQLRRYAACERVLSIVVVVERTASAPATVGGKPCRVFGLNRLWGIAI